MMQPSDRLFASRAMIALGDHLHPEQFSGSSLPGGKLSPRRFLEVRDAVRAGEYHQSQDWLDFVDGRCPVNDAIAPMIGHRSPGPLALAGAASAFAAIRQDSVEMLLAHAQRVSTGEASPMEAALALQAYASRAERAFGSHDRDGLGEAMKHLEHAILARETR